MILKIFDLKKGNRDQVVSKSSYSSLVKKEREQVKIKRYAGMDGNFLSHAHYRDPKKRDLCSVHGKEIPVHASIPFDLHLFTFFFHQ